MSANPDNPLSRLPHREPFRFISNVDLLEAGIRGTGTWTVEGGEAFLAGHFPGDPIVPGVLIGEALAQLCGLVGGDVAAAGGARPAFLARLDVRFRTPVTPPAQIALAATHVRSLGSLEMFEVAARVNGAIVAEGSVVLGGSRDT